MLWERLLFAREGRKKKKKELLLQRNSSLGVWRLKPGTTFLCFHAQQKQLLCPCSNHQNPFPIRKPILSSSHCPKSPPPPHGDPGSFIQTTSIPHLSSDGHPPITTSLHNHPPLISHFLQASPAPHLDLWLYCFIAFVTSCLQTSAQTLSPSKQDPKAAALCLLLLLSAVFLCFIATQIKPRLICSYTVTLMQSQPCLEHTPTALD